MREREQSLPPLHTVEPEEPFQGPEQQPGLRRVLPQRRKAERELFQPPERVQRREWSQALRKQRAREYSRHPEPAFAERPDRCDCLRSSASSPASWRRWMAAAHWLRRLVARRRLRQARNPAEAARFRRRAREWLRLVRRMRRNQHWAAEPWRLSIRAGRCCGRRCLPSSRFRLGLSCRNKRTERQARRRATKRISKNGS